MVPVDAGSGDPGRTETAVVTDRVRADDAAFVAVGPNASGGQYDGAERRAEYTACGAKHPT